jgi:S1-C subfamily serine protease
LLEANSCNEAHEMFNPRNLLWMQLWFLPAFAMALLNTQHVSAQDFRGLFKKVDPSVVTIQAAEIVAGSRSQVRRSLGTGFIVSDDGNIMTAAHVVQTADQITVKFVDGTESLAKIVSSVPGADVALIKVETLPANSVIATLGDSDKTETGAPSFVIGNPFGIEHSLSIGYISGAQTRPVIAAGQPLKVIQTDASVNHGNSGGPLFNEHGEVIGIVSHILSEGGGFDGIGFAVAINEAKKILLEQSPIWTGFEATLLTPEIAKILNIPQRSALLVQRVNRNSMAYRAGLRGGTDSIVFRDKKVLVGGDIILEIEDTVCDCTKSFMHIRESLNSLEDGQAIKVKVLRGGKIVELNFTQQ